MWIYKFWKNMILSPFFSIPRCLKLTILRNIESFRYSHVHISSDEVFSKIMKKPSMMPHMKAKLIFIGNFFWKPKNKNKKKTEIFGKKYWELAELENDIFFLLFVSGYWVFQKKILSMKISMAFIWGNIYFCSMDFFQNLEKGFIRTNMHPTLNVKLILP
jgi:hypothetical protein